VLSAKEISRLRDCAAPTAEEFTFPAYRKIWRPFRGPYFHVASDADINAEVSSWLRESYKVGAQQD
jgi:hypothetical protein